MRRLLGMISLCALTACGANAAAETHTHPPHRAPTVSAGTSPDPGLAVAGMAVYVATVHYLEAQQVAAYLEAAAYLASLTPPPIAASSTPSSPSTARSGGHSDAWWTGVAQCEQGGRNDPFFGYFSFMDGSQGGQPWAEQVAAGNAVLANSASESPAWAASCVAAGYAASPGG